MLYNEMLAVIDNDVTLLLTFTLLLLMKHKI